MGKRDRYLLPVIFLLLTDIGVFAGAIYMSFQVRFSEWFTFFIWPLPEGCPPPIVDRYIALAIYVTLIGLFIVERFGFYSYREGLNRGVRPTAFVLAVVVTYIFLMAWLFLYVHDSYSHSRMVIFLAFLLTTGMGLGSHVVLRNLMQRMVSSGIGFNRTVLVGTESNCLQVLDKLRETHGSFHQIVGLVTAGGNGAKGLDGVPVLGKVDRVSEILDKRSIDRVIVALTEDHYEQACNVLQACRNYRVDCRFVPDLFEGLSRKLDTNSVNGLPTISLGETPLYGVGRWTKEFMDKVIASVALVVASPLMALCAILIKLDSEGPIFYSQERMGSDGRVFTMYKFRTMNKDAELNTGPIWAKENDPRCTAVGSFLRRTNLDELPQIFNVLKGEMSLVGPRPERPFFVNRFKHSVPKYMRRHMVKSGITGWAQVNGLRGNTSVEERTRYDLFYMENWSILFDLKILVRTLFSMKNAY